MNENLKIAAIQTELYWENVTANLASLEEKIANISNDTDLIILPEMFNTGFSMNSKALAEPMNLTTFKWLKQMAAKTNAVITGSYIVSENGNFYNRLIWMQPDGQFDTYDKRHLFRMGGENEHFSAGTKRIIKPLKGWNICPLICYDLRFPVWSRNRNNEYDLLIYVANWPEPRAHVWSNLLIARALENQCYVAGINRVGEDGQGLKYSGDSAIIDFKGHIKATKTLKNSILYAELNKTELSDFRTKFPAYLDADEFEIKVHTH
jgi:omega-amidase